MLNSPKMKPVFYSYSSTPGRIRTAVTGSKGQYD